MDIRILPQDTRSLIEAASWLRLAQKENRLYLLHNPANKAYADKYLSLAVSKYETMLAEACDRANTSGDLFCMVLDHPTGAVYFADAVLRSAEALSDFLDEEWGWDVALLLNVEGVGPAAVADWDLIPVDLQKAFSFFGFSPKSPSALPCPTCTGRMYMLDDPPNRASVVCVECGHQMKTEQPTITAT